MKRAILVLMLGATALLSACAMPGTAHRARSYEGRPEKAMLAVLRSVNADDAQRAAVLTAYDRHNPALTQLAKDWTQIEREWIALDRHDPDFADKAAGLAQRRQQVAAQQMVEGAAFEREVATALTPAQWTDWQELWDLVGVPNDACGPDGPMGPGRR